MVGPKKMPKGGPSHPKRVCEQHKQKPYIEDRERGYEMKSKAHGTWSDQKFMRKGIG